MHEYAYMFMNDMETFIGSIVIPIVLAGAFFMVVMLYKFK